MSAGDQLRLIRNRLGISTRMVEEQSRLIAGQKENEEFFISKGWISKIENGEGTPSICKLYSLCAIYRMKFTDLLLLYQVDLKDLTRMSLQDPLPQTHLIDLSIYDEERSVSFPVRFDPGFNLSQTSLIARMVEAWAEIPIALLQNLNLRQHLYGYIGLNDNSMLPLIHPGSFVQIDDSQTKIVSATWKSEYERPIYFVELRDGYSCCWCELHGSQLFLIPHPLSGKLLRQFAFPREAEIVGRITAVGMRLIHNVPEASTGNARLPRSID